MAVDPWQALRAPLLLPWETGFFKEVMSAGDGRLDGELGLPEAVERADMAAVSLDAHNKRGQEDDNASLNPTELVWDPEEAARVQAKLEEDERAALIAEFASWVQSSEAASHLQEQMTQGADEVEGFVWFLTHLWNVLQVHEPFPNEPVMTVESPSSPTLCQQAPVHPSQTKYS